MSEEFLPPACTVLCIEDDVHLFELLRVILGIGTAVRVLGGPQGEGGLDLACKHRPDLILLDLRLSDLPGEEVLRQLKADERTTMIPVIVLGAESGVRSTTRLMELGAAHCVQKPFGVTELLTAIEAAAGI